MNKVTLFSKSGCHLCDETFDQLVEMQASVLFEIETIDIRSSPELYQRFRTVIPAVRVLDRLFEEGPFTPETLEEILREVSQ